MKNFGIFIFAIFISGCVLMNRTPEGTETGISAGLKLWEQNCSRCHNTPDPSSFTDAEWEIVGSHMRVRAYLTERETNEIINFLQTIN